MSIHIGAREGEIAEAIIISGDPLRIKHMASILLEDAVCVNEVRGMLGYTGWYQGQRISMMGTGMGMPSTAIYLHELAQSYHVKTVIRAGTMGAMNAALDLGDVFLAISASTDSAMNKLTFNDGDFAPTASFELLEGAASICKSKQIPFKVGQVLSTDVFYSEDEHRLQPWMRHGVLGIEMETAAIYTMAARFGMKALSVLSVSDNVITGASASSESREKQYRQMFEIALEVLKVA
jgi:purine-nucleoside phosphorylase